MWLPALLPDLLSASGCLQGPYHPFCIVETGTAHNIQGDTPQTLNIAGESTLLMVWLEPCLMEQQVSNSVISLLSLVGITWQLQ